MTSPTAPASGFLDGRALAQLRRRKEIGMTARAEARRVPSAPIRIGPGQYSDAPVPVPGLAAVKCAFRTRTPGREVIGADAVQALSEFEVEFLPGTPIDESMTLVIAHRVPGIPSPITVQVTGVERRSDPEIVRLVYANRAGAPGAA